MRWSMSWSKGKSALSITVFFLLFAASTALSASPGDKPPAAPTWNFDSGASLADGAFFHHENGSVELLFGQVGNATGYRLYVGDSPRSAGNPMTKGNTPCDLGAGGSGATRAASFSGCLGSFTTNVYVAVTSYNEYGNEGDYSEMGVAVPILKPSGLSLTAGGTKGVNTKTMTLAWTPGTAPSGASVRTDIFRLDLDDTSATQVFVTRATGENYTDSGLQKDTTYRYTLRSVGLGSDLLAGSPVTYSDTVSSQKKTSVDVYNVTVQGTKIGGNETFVTDLASGDFVEITGGSGQVTFNTTSQTCAPSVYKVGAGGLGRAVYQDPANLPCYAADLSCNDPVGGGPHAALYLQRSSTDTLVGTGGSTFGPIAGADTLSFFVNDCPATGNSGSFSVTVTVSRP